MRNMARRRKMLISASQGESRLPEEYQEVEWLRGTGTQWCTVPYKLGFNSSHFYGLRGSVELLNDETSTTLRIASNFDYSLATGFWGVQIINGDLRVNIPNHIYVIYDELIYYFELNSDNVIINNRSWDNLTYSQILGNNIIIGGGINYSGTFEVNNNNVLIKSLSITVNDQIIAEVIPCYRKADYKPGFYVTNVPEGYSNFIVNEADGTDWLIGPNV